MKFEATKCDECQRIQGEANHWVQIQVWMMDIRVAGVVLGPISMGGLTGVSSFTTAKPEIHDICGQGCAVKHIAKLLGWNLPVERAAGGVE